MAILAATSMGVQSASDQPVLLQETRLIHYVEPIKASPAEPRVSHPANAEALLRAAEQSDIPQEYFDEDLSDV